MRQPFAAILVCVAVVAVARTAHAQVPDGIRDFRAVGDAATTPVPKDATVLDLAGRTVIPGLVGMHDHLFMTSIRSNPIFINQVGFSATRLYLASGVTTIRTTGSLEP